MGNRADFCPIAAAVEVLGDRWTPLVLRELMVGATGFNEIHRGLPRISRTLLAQRLRQLVRDGLVDRHATGPGRPVHYRFTPAGAAVVPVLQAMGEWAAEWAFSEIDAAEIDGTSVLWRMHQYALPLRLPPTRTVVHVVLTGAGRTEGWLDVDAGQVGVCTDDPGVDVQLMLVAETRHVQRWLIGAADFEELLDSGHARLLGDTGLARDFPSWFDTAGFRDAFHRGRRRQADGTPAPRRAMPADSVPA